MDFLASFVSWLSLGILLDSEAPMYGFSDLIDVATTEFVVIFGLARSE